ncbi:MAG: hypothetical protein JO320_06900, partial [Alphaproteobacteria bacterium]|nr:hypothetical protein [Alphaproteobacteria bacterium]
MRSPDRLARSPTSVLARAMRCRRARPSLRRLAVPPVETVGSSSGEAGVPAHSYSARGIAEVLGQLLTDRGFEFAVERAVFASVLHRLFVSGSDRSCEKWMADYQITGI